MSLNGFAAMTLIAPWNLLAGQVAMQHPTLVQHAHVLAAAGGELLRANVLFANVQP